MTPNQVFSLLKKNRNERGIAHWERLGVKKLESYGIGLTQLRKLAKQVGRSHDLAQELWKSDVYDAKVVGALIDDPARITKRQAESQVKELSFWMFSHVVCSCDSPLSRSPIARELAETWSAAKHPVRRRCGYLLLAELAKDRKDAELNDAFFEGYIDLIADTVQREENFVKDAMNLALLAIGQRNAKLHKKALAAAKAIGRVEVNYGSSTCESIDVAWHLSSDRVRAKLA